MSSNSLDKIRKQFNQHFIHNKAPKLILDPCYWNLSRNLKWYFTFEIPLITSPYNSMDAMDLFIHENIFYVCIHHLKLTATACPLTMKNSLKAVANTTCEGTRASWRWRSWWKEVMKNDNQNKEAVRQNYLKCDFWRWRQWTES